MTIEPLEGAVFRAFLAVHEAIRTLPVATSGRVRPSASEASVKSEALVTHTEAPS